MTDKNKFVVSDFKTQQLFPVKLLKTDTCLTYALKRSGLALYIKDAIDIDKVFDVERILSPDPQRWIDELQKGFIVMWTQDERNAIAPTEITEDGIILSHPTILLRHFGVYEGNGMISDCTISARDYPFCKTIRIRRISELKVLPTHILYRKK